VSDILKYVLENVAKLKPFDYVLIFFVVLVIAFGVFIIIRWLYGELIKSQSHLIEIKDQTIGEYKRQLEKYKEDQILIENSLSTIKKDFAELQSKHEKISYYNEMGLEAFKFLQDAYLKAISVILGMTSMRLYLEKINTSRQFIYVYNALREKSERSDLPDSIDFLIKFDELEKNLIAAWREVDPLINRLNKNNQFMLSEDIPQKFLAFGYDNWEKTYEKIINEVFTLSYELFQEDQTITKPDEFLRSLKNIHRR